MPSRNTVYHSSAQNVGANLAIILDQSDGAGNGSLETAEHCIHKHHPCAFMRFGLHKHHLAVCHIDESI